MSGQPERNPNISPPKSSNISQAMDEATKSDIIGGALDGMFAAAQNQEVQGTGGFSAVNFIQQPDGSVRVTHDAGQNQDDFFKELMLFDPKAAEWMKEYLKKEESQDDNNPTVCKHCKMHPCIQSCSST